MTNKDLEAKQLAAAHYQAEPGVTHIFRVYVAGQAEARPDEPIKLLEVNENTIAAGVMPLGFSPAPDIGIHHPSIILEVTPEEFEQIQREQLRLPSGWNLGDLLPRPSRGAVA
jgi:hypothetical protein